MELFGVPVVYLLVGIAATTVGAIVQGSVGFGLAVVSAPILLMVAPQFVPGSLMLSATVLTLMMFFRERHAVVKREVFISATARLVTTIPTAYVVSIIDQRLFSILFAVVILVAVSISLSGVALPFTTSNLVLASCVSGISNTVSAVGGPPMALVYQTQHGAHIRSTLSAIFAIGSTLSMICLAVVGEFTFHDILLGLMLMPGIFLGFAISRYTVRLIDQHTTRPAVLAIAGLSAVVILVRALMATG
ncbi:sulfite exporter TauE/SafE family protein [Aeoliella sp. ICT_H6.2]|uniref:Probable membrane transporter protein n=1 Tax=Aeoliella straminimaris TaxID=2954799 RepID=A0A9X2FCU0_9BACT|nr:sulfite exporter TauE/SafE family protein [Aeoliella straminimaris]